ncbi:MAG: hypothetical protein PF961_19680 [Planctomycetota bacterium]|jgi:hypothetical protein|nr:hypothetical protein [Planctomycetota bacterium]
MSESTTAPTASGAQAIPSHAQLIKAMAIALSVAGVLLVTTIMPAEYGIDPTGAGRLMGLTGISEASTEAPVALDTGAASGLAQVLTNVSSPYQTDITTVTLPPGQGLEVKAVMEAGQVMTFAWVTDGGAVSLDMHGEPPGDGSNFTSHRKGQNETAAQGIFVAPFAGTHGWWWANKTKAPITVTLQTSGFYTSIGKR